MDQYTGFSSIDDLSLMESICWLSTPHEAEELPISLHSFYQSRHPMVHKEIVIENVGAVISHDRRETLWQHKRWDVEDFNNCLLDPKAYNVFEIIVVAIKQERYPVIG